MTSTVQIITADTDVVTYTLSHDAVVAIERAARIAADAVLQANIDAVSAGGVSDGDKGDITVSSSGTVWTINSSALASKASLSGGNTFSGAQVMSHTSGPVLNVSRSDTATTTTSVAAQLTAVTSNDMGDGFGPLLVFRVTDTGVTNEMLGAVGFVRSGGDTTGDFVVRPQVAGVATELFRFKADGTTLVNGFTFAVTANATVAGNNTGDQTITLTGDATGSGTGSFAVTLANTAVSAGSYSRASLTVDAKGRLTAAATIEDFYPISAGFDGAVSTGKLKGFAVALQAGTIVGWNATVDAGTLTFKVWKIATGTAKPTSANSINTSGVSLSTGTHVTSTTVTDFTTTAVAAGDIFAFELTAVSGATEGSVGLRIKKT